MSRLRLGINVDHIATVRQARRGAHPDPVEAALFAERAGADGITVHLREDRRHIQEEDVLGMRGRLSAKLNLEMAATDEMVEIACRIVPGEVCLVPERREELTTEGGLDVCSREAALSGIVGRLQDAGIPVFLFVDPEPRQIEASLRTGARGVELHTGAYAECLPGRRADEVARLGECATKGAGLGLEVHAGHGLDLDNVAAVAALPEIEELNIGHSIVARALFVGIEAAVREMRERLEETRRAT